jgi:hypothetical protein
MLQRRIVIPSGCAKSACLEHSAHPLSLSAHFEMRKLLTFLSCCGHLGLVRPQEFSLSPTHEFHLARTRCAGVASLYRVDAPKAQLLRIRRIYLPGRRISKCEHYWLFDVVVDIGVSLASWVLPLSPAHKLQRKHATTRCAGVASLYQVDALKAPLLRIKRINLACRRISL